MHRYLLFRIIVIVFVETITHYQILFVNSEISEDKITNVEKPLIFVVHGIGELITASPPKNLNNLLGDIGNFCSDFRYTIFKAIPEHRCEWLVGGALLEALAKRHGHNIVENNFLKVKEDKSVILPLSKPQTLQESAIFNMGLLQGKSILFLLHDATPEKKHVLNGGTQAIMEVAFGLATIGKMNVKIACLNSAIPIFEDAYPDIKNLNIFVGYEMFTKFIETYKNKSMSSKLPIKYDYIVATYFVTIWMVKSIQQYINKVATTNPKLIYFVQDYEAWFPLPIAYKYAAKLSYVALKSFNIRVCTYSSWIKNMLHQYHNLKLHLVDTHPISLFQGNYNLKYNKLIDSKNNNIRVGIMLRPYTPRRGTVRSLNLLDRFARLNISNLEFHTFGCTMSNFNNIYPSVFYENNTKTFLKHHGILNRTEMAYYFQNIDIFVDLSLWQAFGFTAFEGMSNGVVPIIQNTSGLSSYVMHNLNGVLVKENDEAPAASPQRLLIPYIEAIKYLVEHKTILNTLRWNAKTSTRKYKIDKTVKSWIKILEK